MSVFGCHSCGVDITKYPDYMSSPCATCKLATEYYNTKRASMFDSAGGSDYDEDAEENEALARCDKALETAGDDPIAKRAAQFPLTMDQLAVLKKAIEDQLMIAISGILLKLLKLGQISPVMLELVIKKMQYPLMSYSELGASMKEPFSKQNVLYHLKHAVELIPELSSALLTDTRFSRGKYALKTLAQEAKQTYAEKTIQGILYGDDPAFQARRLTELNAILQAPFLMDKEVFEFNPYIKNEEK